MRSSTDEQPILVTIPISHFCEKARWALERAGVGYAERRHLQILHGFAAKRAGGGITVPVLRTAAAVYDQSSAIMRFADEQLPEERRLYPADTDGRAEVDALERRFDEVLGPEGRRWLYHEVFKDAKRFAPWNLTGIPRWERRIFPVVLAPAKVIINRYFKITDATAAAAITRVDEEFDAVAQLLSDGRGHLAGDRFSAADLAFAALAAPCVVPPQYGTPLPQPEEMTASMAAQVQRWRAHPAGRYALRMYREERPPPKVTSL